MNQRALKAELDAAIQKFQKQAENLERRGLEDDFQEALNILTNSTLAALKDFRNAILNSCE